MSNPTQTKEAAEQVKLPICPYCHADPLIYNIVDSEMGCTVMYLRQMSCSNCNCFVACFPVLHAPQQSPISVPGGRLPGKPLVDA